jgi:hypothetical protein
MSIDEIRKRFETSDRIISAAHARGEHGPSMDMHAAANIDIAALLAAHDLQSARADAAEALADALRGRAAPLEWCIDVLGECVRMWLRRAEVAEARVAELEAQRTGPASEATEGMYDAAFFTFCFASDRSPRDGTYRWLTAAINAALRKGREEGVL